MDVIGWAIQGASAIVVLYVSYRMLQMKEWFRTEMTHVVKENCAGKVEFQEHVKADELFQRNLLENIVEKRTEYTRQHSDHYAHAANTGIHQESMSADVLREKFENVKDQVAGVQARVDRLTKMMEKTS